MPFPWKKVKNTKISQLVSDHLESQRRQRGHLVVETGFPTSLVDLFVKNRDRLKKPISSKKNKKAQNIDFSSPLPPSSSPFPSYQGPRPSPSSSPSISPLISQSPSSSSLASSLAVPSSSVAANDSLKEADEIDEVMNERPSAKGVLGAILRLSFVVVLALGAKKFTVGLTMSAFLLFLVEYVGKISYRLLVPCSGAKRRLRLIMQGVFQVISFRDKIFDENYDGGTGTKGQLGTSSRFNNHIESSPICEIQIAEPTFMDHVQCLRNEIGTSSSDSSELQFEKGFHEPRCDGKSQLERSDSKMMVVEEKEGKDEYDICESKKGKRARMKKKIKNLVSRKFRGSKKGKRDFEAETNPMKEGIVAILEEPQENEPECDGRSSLSSSTRLEGNDETNMICSSGAVSEENFEQSVIREEQKIQRKGNSGYLIICVVALIGLIGGRLIAFLSMVLWFLMWESSEKLRRYIKSLACDQVTH